jgi:predicted nucleic acid-binding protein
MICLDHDVLRKFADPDPDPNVVTYLSQHRGDIWILPSLVLFEYLQLYSSQSRIRTERSQIEHVVDEVAPLDGDVAAQAANMNARLASAGTSLDLADLLIAATARENNATLATANKHDFDKPPIHQLMDIDIVEPN